jgi:hypothetical protein
MLVKIETNKNTFSSWLLAVFALTIVVSALYSHFFRAPRKANPELSKYRRLFSKNQLSNLVGLKLENNLGVFEFKSDQFRDWKMISPRMLPARNDVLTTVLKTLEGIQVRKPHTKDSINISNFSLDAPLIKVEFTNQKGQISKLSLGLINPIDNSTYAMLDTQDAIYHIDALQVAIGPLDLSSFIDSKIFSIDPRKVTKIQVLKGENRLRKHMTLEKKERSWVDSRKRPLSNEKVEAYLKALTEIKSSLILDAMNDDLKGKVDKSFEKLAYKILLTTEGGRNFKFEIGPLLHSLPGLKLEKWQTFLIRSSHRSHPSIIGKSSLKVFSRTENQLKALSIKKLFY